MQTSLINQTETDLSDYFEKKTVITQNMEFRSKIVMMIDLIDKLLNKQVTEILTHTAFKSLQASWLGLHYLIKQCTGHKNIIIRILDISWEKLAENIMRYNEMSSNLLFQLVYCEEFDMPGGKPYGLLIGDYYLDIAKNRDISVLQNLAEICAEAFVPFITSILPHPFDVDNFGELDLVFDFETIMQQTVSTQWHEFRKQESARFLAFALPRILYDSHYKQIISDGKLAKPTEIWGHPSYALAAVICRCYTNTNWFLEIVGAVSPKTENKFTGGLIPNLHAPYYTTDQRPLVAKCLTEVWLTETQERALQSLGFISVSHCIHTDSAAFNAATTVKDRRDKNNNEMSLNHELTTSLQYMLCVCRFAHYIKIIGRDKIGSHLSAQQCEDYLQNWITNYVASNTDISLKMKARYPLRAAKVTVTNYPAWSESKLQCTIEISPHLRTTQTVATITLKTQMRKVIKKNQI